MAPTISEVVDRRRPPSFSLEEHLQRTLRLSPNNDSVRCGLSKRNPTKSNYQVNATTVCAVMGLVVEQEYREGDSPTLPLSNTHLVTVGHHGSTRRASSTCGGGVLSRKEDLIDITLRTMALLKRNQLLQKRLTALQKETRAFVMSVLKEQQQQKQHNNEQQKLQSEQEKTQQPEIDDDDVDDEEQMEEEVQQHLTMEDNIVDRG